MRHAQASAYTVAVICCAAAAVPAAIGGGDADLSWHTIDGGGGGSSTGGGFELAGTIGQHDAGPAMTGGDFAVVGGFWPGVGASPPSMCPWDLDGTGRVGVSDLISLLERWGRCEGCPADFDGDGNVGVSDLVVLLANWGPCPKNE